MISKYNNLSFSSIELIDIFKYIDKNEDDIICLDDLKEVMCLIDYNKLKYLNIIDCKAYNTNNINNIGHFNINNSCKSSISIDSKYTENNFINLACLNNKANNDNDICIKLFDILDINTVKDKKLIHKINSSNIENSILFEYYSIINVYPFENMTNDYSLYINELTNFNYNIEYDEEALITMLVRTSLLDKLIEDIKIHYLESKYFNPIIVFYLLTNSQDINDHYYIDLNSYDNINIKDFCKKLIYYNIITNITDIELELLCKLLTNNNIVFNSNLINVESFILLFKPRISHKHINLFDNKIKIIRLNFENNKLKLKECYNYIKSQHLKLILKQIILNESYIETLKEKILNMRCFDYNKVFKKITNFNKVNLKEHENSIKKIENINNNHYINCFVNYINKYITSEYLKFNKELDSLLVHRFCKFPADEKEQSSSEKVNCLNYISYNQFLNELKPSFLKNS